MGRVGRTERIRKQYGQMGKEGAVRLAGAVCFRGPWTGWVLLLRDVMLSCGAGAKVRVNVLAGLDRLSAYLSACLSAYLPVSLCTRPSARLCIPVKRRDGGRPRLASCDISPLPSPPEIALLN